MKYFVWGLVFFIVGASNAMAEIQLEQTVFFDVAEYRQQVENVMWGGWLDSLTYDQQRDVVVVCCAEKLSNDNIAEYYLIKNVATGDIGSVVGDYTHLSGESADLSPADESLSAEAIAYHEKRFPSRPGTLGGTIHYVLSSSALSPQGEYIAYIFIGEDGHYAGAANILMQSVETGDIVIVDIAHKSTFLPQLLWIRDDVLIYVHEGNGEVLQVKIVAE